MLLLRSLTLDLDGTLLDTLDDLTAGCNGMLGELGLSAYSREVISGFVGDGMHTLVERCLVGAGVALDDGLLLQALDAFRRHYGAANGQGARPYPGVLEGLVALRDAGLALAVVTNKPAQFTEPLLLASGLSEFFHVVLSGDSLPHKKPHPLPILHACTLLGSSAAQNLHVGDSKNDVLAARAAGCPVFCVPYGYRGGASVDTLSGDALVSGLPEVAQRVRLAG